MYCVWKFNKFDTDVKKFNKQNANDRSTAYNTYYSYDTLFIQPFVERDSVGKNEIQRSFISTRAPT